MRNTLTIISFLILATTANANNRIDPPKLTTPPPVANSGFLTAYAEETVPMGVRELRLFIKKQPVINFLKPTKNISNPVSTEILKGKWPNPGAVRQLKLADGHYVVERVIENKLDFFKYQVFIFTNSTGRGVEQIVGEQRFVPVENGTEFQWTYNVRPRNAFTKVVVKARMREIQGYISDGLEGFANAATKAAGK